MRNIDDKLTWGDFYGKESIKDNERLLRYEESYNGWDNQNQIDWDYMYEKDREDEKERYKKYLDKVRNNK